MLDATSRSSTRRARVICNTRDEAGSPVCRDHAAPSTCPRTLGPPLTWRTIARNGWCTSGCAAAAAARSEPAICPRGSWPRPPERPRGTGEPSNSLPTAVLGSLPPRVREQVPARSVGRNSVDHRLGGRLSRYYRRPLGLRGHRWSFWLPRYGAAPSQRHSSISQLACGRARSSAGRGSSCGGRSTRESRSLRESE